MRRLRSTTRPLTWLSAQVDAEERRLLFQAVVVGVVVWGFVATLKWTVRAGLVMTQSLLEHAPSTLFAFIPLVLGAAGVALVAGFRRTAVHYRDEHDKVHAIDTVEGDGLERAIALYFASEPTLDRALLGSRGVDARWRLPTFSLVLRKMVATFLTLSSGGAGGLEGSVTLVGESTAAGLFKPRSLSRVLPESVRNSLPARARVGLVSQWFRRALLWWRASHSDDLQAAQLCGIAAAISTLLGTPFAAAFFAIEVIYRRRPIIDRLIYALVSSLIAFFLNHLVTGAHSSFAPVSTPPPLYVGRYYLALSAVAVSMGLLSIGFRTLRSWAERTFHTHIASSLRRLITGALITGTFAVSAAWIVGWFGWPLPAETPSGALWLVLGTGENIIQWALEGQLGVGVALIALASRFGATVSTITSGGSGGLLYPTLTFGCLVACVWSGLLKFDAALLVIPAMTASLASVANVPLAAILLVVEGFGAQWIVPAMFVLVLSSLFAHRNSIYRAQRESFDRGQILPGVSVRRIRVPGAWAGHDLRSLGVRERFGLTVIGMVDRRDTPDGNLEEHVVLNPSPGQRLTRDDLLIVLGEDERLERFAKASAEATLTGRPAYGTEASS